MGIYKQLPPELREVDVIIAEVSLINIHLSRYS